MPSALRCSDGQHAQACVERFGSGRKAIKSCNQCKFLKLRHKWERRAPWLQQSAPDKMWGLGCRICNEASRSSGIVSASSPWVAMTKGQSGILQIEDIVRHGECEVHLKAAAAESSSSLEASAEDSAQGKPCDTPTAAQIRLSLEVTRCPLGGQSVEFERKCELASRSDCYNYPRAFNSRHVHCQIVECLASVLPLCRGLCWCQWFSLELSELGIIYGKQKRV